MGKPIILRPDENTVIQVQNDLNGGSLVVVGTTPKPFHIRLSHENTIGVGLALLQAAGIPIEETYRRQQAAKEAKA